MTTNAFATRHQVKEKISELSTQLSELWGYRDRSYGAYLFELEHVMPRTKERAATARQIAALLSQDEDERRSIAQSIMGFAVAAEHNRENLKHDRGDLVSPTFPNLRYVEMTRVRHYAELDDFGNIIKQHDKEEPIRLYYFGED